MKRRLIIGGISGLASYAFYRWNAQKAAWAPQSVPLGNLVDPLDPIAYASIALGVLLGYAL